MSWKALLDLYNSPYTHHSRSSSSPKILRMAQRVLCITTACLLLRKELLQEVLVVDTASRMLYGTYPHSSKPITSGLWEHLVCGSICSVETPGLWEHLVCGSTWSAGTPDLWEHLVVRAPGLREHLVCRSTWSVGASRLWEHLVHGSTCLWEHLICESSWSTRASRLWEHLVLENTWSMEASGPWEHPVLWEHLDKCRVAQTCFKQLPLLDIDLPISFPNRWVNQLRVYHLVFIFDSPVPRTVLGAAWDSVISC